MLRNGKTSAAAWFCAYMLLALTRATVAAEPVTAWAPKDAIIFVGIPNVDEMTAAYKKTSGYKSLEDPALKEKLKPWMKLGENLQKLVAGKLGLDSPQELEVLPHGGLAAYLTVDLSGGEGKEEFHICVVADMGEDADKARSLAAKVIQSSVEKGAQKKTTEAAGTEITSIQFKSAEGAESDAAITSTDVDALLEGVELEEMFLEMVKQLSTVVEVPEEFALAFAGSRLVVGSDAGTVEAAIGRLRSPSEDTLASIPAVRNYGKRCPGTPHGLFVANWPALVKGIGESADEDDRKIMQALGLEAFGPLVMSAQFAVSEELDSRAQGFLEVDTSKSGIPRMLKMENTAAVPPPGVSADTAMYMSTNLDPSLIMKEVLAIAERIDAEEAEQMRQSLRMPQEDGSTLDIQKDIVDQLAGPLAAWLTLSKPFDAEHCNLLVTLGHKSREAMTKLASLLPPGLLTQSEIMGQAVYEVPMVPGLTMGYTQRVLIPVATKNGLEAYIRSEGNPGRGLAEDPAFRRLARLTASRGCGMIYLNALLIADAQVALAEADDIDAEMPPMGGQFSEYLRWGLGAQASKQDVELLKASRKYQSQLLAIMISESEGIRFDAVAIPVSDASK